MYHTVFNTTDSPVYDEQGRALAGREWSPVDTADEQVRTALDDGRLVIVDVEPAADSDPRFVAAHARTMELEALRAKPKAKLAAAATKAGLDATGTKSELVTALADKEA